MFLEFQVISALVEVWRSRRASLPQRSEAGYSTETVVVTALLVALAIAAVAIIASKVLAKANSISTGG